jgi:glycosyltransferase involved in cell wall biosynthesis
MDRISLIISSLRPGGAERAMINLSQGLVEIGSSVDLVVFDGRGPYREILPPAVRLVDLKARRVFNGLPALRSYLRKRRPAAVISAMDHVNLATLLSGFSSGVSPRTVLTVHRIVGRPDENGWGPTRAMVRLMARWLYPLADEVVAVSHATRLSLATGLGLSDKSIKVIPNAVVHPELMLLSELPIQDPWFEPGAPDVIVSAGRLKYHKDFGTLIEAAAQIAKRRSVHLMILGEGSARPALERLVHMAGLGGAIRLPGFVLNPYPYFARARLYVQSSLSEAFGIALVEAMAMGTSVVSTSCGGPEEILGHGTYGRLVPVADPECLAQAILETLDEPDRAQGLRERAMEYSIERVTRMYMRLLNA